MAVSAEARRNILAGAIGNVLECYDFAIYGYFAAEIGRTFFEVSARRRRRGSRLVRSATSCSSAPADLMVEEVPAAVRCTAIAIGYNVTLGVIGGLSPLVATWLVARTADQLAPAYMVMAAAAVSFPSVLTFRAGRARLEAATSPA